MNIKRNQIKPLLNFLTGCELMKSNREQKKQQQQQRKKMMENINRQHQHQPSITFTERSSHMLNEWACPHVSKSTEWNYPKYSRYFSINDSRTSLIGTSHDYDFIVTMAICHALIIIWAHKSKAVTTRTQWDREHKISIFMARAKTMSIRFENGQNLHELQNNGVKYLQYANAMRQTWAILISMDEMCFR